MRNRGVDTAAYFSPHVAEQDYFRGNADLDSLPITNDIASRVLTLPLFDTMTEDEVFEVISVTKAVLARIEQAQAPAIYGRKRKTMTAGVVSGSKASTREQLQGI